MAARWIAWVSASTVAVALATPLATAQQSTADATVAAVATPQFAPQPEAAAEESAQRGEFKTLDADVQDLKSQVLDLNRDLFLLEEELLFPSNTQVAIFVSMDVGEFFALDSVELKVDDKDVASYLYTEREADALIKGGVQRLFVGNLKAGEHELVAVFTGDGTHERDYRRGAALKFEKGIGPKYIELTITDRESKQQPEFVVKEWE